MSSTSGAVPGPGEILLGKYRVERELGHGGMGVVLAARHIDLDERVAIKLVLPQYAAHEEAVARFVREARAVAKMRSEHVVKVRDIGRLPQGSPYMVMELLEGEDLAARAKRNGPMALVEAVEHVMQACEALAEAHGVGIVHRDLKPSNLFLSTNLDGTPCLKILDFGVSKVSAPEEQGFTSTQSVLGSPLYMSPEQLHAPKTVDARTDVWGLGVVLFELLSQRFPFEAETMPQLVAQVLAAPPRALRSLRPDLPPAFEEVVLRCLAKDREARFPSVEALAAALAPFGRAEATNAAKRVALIASRSGKRTDPGMVADAAAVRASTPGTDAPWTESAPAVRPPPRRSRVIVPVAIAALAVVGVGAFLAIHAVSGATTRTTAASASPIETVATTKPIAPAATPSDAPTASAPAASSTSATSASAKPSATSTVQTARATTTRPTAVPTTTVKKPTTTTNDDPFGDTR